MSGEAAEFTHYGNKRRKVIRASPIIEHGLDNRVVHVARIFKVKSDQGQLIMCWKSDLT